MKHTCKMFHENSRDDTINDVFDGKHVSVYFYADVIDQNSSKVEKLKNNKNFVNSEDITHILLLQISFILRASSGSYSIKLSRKFARIR